MSRVVVAAAILAAMLAALACAPVARAQEASATRAEVTALEAELQRAAGLTSGACAIACPALGSMKRAADRICVLDPGPRCDAARAKVKEARRKVEQACPECVAEKDEERPIEANEKKSPILAPPPPPADARPTTPQAAPAESVGPGQRGCAGCETTADPKDTPTALAGALALLGIAARRPRRR